MSIKRLCLGTAQFGMDYGINNVIGKPDEKNVFRMLDYCLDRGLDSFDTAQAYGNAEELLGRYIKLNKRNMKIITKIIPKEQISMEEQIIQSMKILNVEYLEGVLFHQAQDINNETFLEEITLCKKKGLINKVGVSVYEPQDAHNAMENRAIDIVQVPYNVLDQRLEESFFLNNKMQNADIYARSIFLQGLLMMDFYNIPKKLEEARPYIQLFEVLVKKYGLSKKEVAIGFVLANPAIKQIVFGVDHINQLEEYLNIAEEIQLSKACMQEIKEAFKQIERRIISPQLW